MHVCVSVCVCVQFFQSPSGLTKTIPSGHSPAARSSESSVSHVVASVVLLRRERVGGRFEGQTKQSKGCFSLRKGVGG